MNPRTSLLVLPVLVLPVLAVAGPSAAAVPAERVERTVQAGYDCTTASGGSEPIELQVALDLPLSVAPGDTVAVTGTARLTFAAKRTQNAQLLLNSKATAELPKAALELTSGKETTALALTEVKPATAKVAKPVVTEATFALPAFEVADDAERSIALALPANPAEAAAPAFTTVLAFAGGIPTKQTFGCRLPTDAVRPSVQVPVVSTAPPPRNPAAPAPAGPPVSAPAALPAGLPAPGVVVPAVPVVDPALPEVTTATAFSVYDPVPAATRTSGVLIPEWLLVVAGFGVVAAAAAVAAGLGRRLRRLQAIARDESEGA